jgi:hypothetical protein
MTFNQMDYYCFEGALYGKVISLSPSGHKMKYTNKMAHKCSSI